MEELARLNLVRARELLHARPLLPSVLARLWEIAARGAGQVLRVSPARTVLRVSAPGETPGEWLLKLFHPRRSGEGLRRALAAPPALREARNARRLGFAPVYVAQPWPSLGLYARPWVEALEARTWQPGAADWGRELARLHAAGWSDPDLAPADLVWTAPGEMIPVDLNHAVVGHGPAPLLAQRRDLILLLAGLEPPPGREFAAALLAAHPALLRLEGHDGGPLLAEARHARATGRWRRSARCLRDCSDFEATPAGARRRGLAELPRDGAVVKEGWRSRVLRAGPWALKEYRRPRQRLGPGPARRAYRAFYRLELEDLPAARAWAWERSAGGEVLVTSWEEGRPASGADLPALAAYLARLHRAGLGLRDAKRANFVMAAAGPVLIDADGVTSRSGRRARDLARLLAESPPDSPAEGAALAAYNQDAEESFRLSRLARPLAAFRAKLAYNEVSA